MPQLPDKSDGLTRRQREWLEAARKLYALHGTAPTWVELAVAAGCASGAAARRVCGGLKRKGYLVRVPTAAGRRRSGPAEQADDTGR
jgi:SOS-response transcriptional repressor LexA